jgi:hypothetical protein
VVDAGSLATAVQNAANHAPKSCSSLLCARGNAALAPAWRGSEGAPLGVLYQGLRHQRERFDVPVTASGQACLFAGPNCTYPWIHAGPFGER